MIYEKDSSVAAALNWWDEDLTKLERSDIKQAWQFLSGHGKVKTGTDASTSDNLSAIFNTLLEDMNDFYGGKLDAEYRTRQHKYRQIFEIVSYLTKKVPLMPAALPDATFEGILQEDDELQHSVSDPSSKKNISTKDTSLQGNVGYHVLTINSERGKADKEE